MSVCCVSCVAQMGVGEGKSVGEWYGPNTVAQVLKQVSFSLPKIDILKIVFCCKYKVYEHVIVLLLLSFVLALKQWFYTFNPPKSNGLY